MYRRRPAVVRGGSLKSILRDVGKWSGRVLRVGSKAAPYIADLLAMSGDPRAQAASQGIRKGAPIAGTIGEGLGSVAGRGRRRRAPVRRARAAPAGGRRRAPARRAPAGGRKKRVRRM